MHEELINTCQVKCNKSKRHLLHFLVNFIISLMFKTCFQAEVLFFFPTHFKKVADSHCEFFDSYLKVFDFQTVGGFSFLFLLLVANLIPLWSDNILCII